MKAFFTIILLLFALNNLIAQDFNEYYFSFEIKNKSELETLTRIISIDDVINNTVYAYATDKSFEEFKSLNYDYKLLSNLSKSAKVDMATTIAEMANWDKYPTHEVYTEMMRQFGIDYPNICKIDTIGFSEDGREVLVAKISGNVDEQENEPEVFYTGQMHGDEIVCYILFLRLIDYLLDNYSTDSQTQNIINNIELWINPLSNPDGTYAGGNNTVNSATRSNSNGVDLNRNYPDPDNGPHPDGKSYQAETQMMMNFADAHNFNLSINSHSGAEVMNYPWDTWSRRHIDDNWYQYASLIYADLAIANSPSGYFTSTSSNGVINGYDWYPISGGRQDYMNYYKNCREITLELSKIKMLSATQLPDHWNYNKEAMLAFIEERLNGIRGTVKDSEGYPINAMIQIENHDTDIDSSMVFTDPDIGDYHRVIEPGTYSIIASAYGFVNDTIENVIVLSENCQSIDFILTKDVSYTLTGIITDATNGDKIENAQIKINEMPIDPVLTDINGEYFINEIIEGNYDIEIYKSGYTKLKANISINSVDTVFSFSIHPAEIEDFETNDFYKFDWQLSGNGNWETVNADFFEGSYAIKSGAISHSNSSIISLQADIKNGGILTFYKKVSSESGYDYLKFFIDDIEQDKWSGINDWSIEEFEVESGIHTFTWKYVKDGNNSHGSDCAWLDYISFPKFVEEVDSIDLSINTEFIIDTLYFGEEQEYDIIISNTSTASSAYYTIEIEDFELNKWITINKSSGTLINTNNDTIVTSLITDNIDAGNYSTNITITTQDLDIYTIPVDLLIKDTIWLEVTPEFIIDTLNIGDSSEHIFVIKNISNQNLEYSVALEFPVKSQSWVELSKNNGTIISESTDTVYVYLNTIEIEPGNHECMLRIDGHDGRKYYYPINLHVKNPQSISDIKSNLTDIKVYPNPFNNYFEIEFYTIDNKYVNISLFDICGRKLYEEKFEPISNSVNNFIIHESDFKSGKLQKGIYFIQLISEKEKVTKRVIKN